MDKQRRDELVDQYAQQRRDELFAAFLAGFDWSGEGCNGEYVRGCHNVPDPEHVHDADFLEQLRGEFDKWLAQRR